jgi:hypothetical protein
MAEPVERLPEPKRSQIYPNTMPEKTGEAWMQDFFKALS